MVAEYDQLTEELQRHCLRLSDDLIVSPQKYGGQHFVHLELESKARFFRINYPEYVFISLLDGNTTLAEALALTAQQLGTDAISETDANRLISWLLENEIATLPAKTPHGQNPGQRENNWLSKLNPFWMKVPLGNPDRLLQITAPYFQWFFHPLVWILLSGFIISSIAAGFIYIDEIAESSTTLFAPENLIFTLLAWVLLKIIHEFAHALTCHRFGGRVPETGIIFILLAPMAYVDATSSWRLKSRFQRMAIASAGMFVELLIASLCLWAWFYVSSPILKQQFTNIMVAAGVTTLLFNANPLMRFDGYFILSDVLKIPNLYGSGSQVFKQHMRWLFLGESNPTNQYEIQTRPWVIAIYGYCAAAWRIIICIGLAITASVMFHGLGVILAVVGIVAWFGQPTMKVIQGLNHTRKSRPHAIFRAAIVATSILTICLGCMYLPNPFAARAACIVDYEDGAKIRTKSAGFISEVLVADGQFVTSGTPLIRLSNFELLAEVKRLEAEVEWHRSAERIALDEGHAGEAQNAHNDLLAVEETLQKRQEELSQLIIRAPRDGRVLAPRLKEQQGQFVPKGQHLISVGSDFSKEIALNISPDQSNVHSLSIGDQVVVEIGSRRRLTATLTRISPKAVSEISHPKLASINGGPLVVQEDQRKKNSGRNDLKLQTPHLMALASLTKSAAEDLYVGERGYAILESSSPNLGSFLYNQAEAWIATQWQLASGGEQ